MSSQSGVLVSLFRLCAVAGKSVQVPPHHRYKHHANFPYWPPNGEPSSEMCLMRFSLAVGVMWYGRPSQVLVRMCGISLNDGKRLGRRHACESENRVGSAECTVAWKHDLQGHVLGIRMSQSIPLPRYVWSTLCFGIHWGRCRTCRCARTLLIKGQLGTAAARTICARDKRTSGHAT